MRSILAALLLAAPALAENAHLARAERLIENFKYADAAHALEAAAAENGNDRATLMKILELQGMVAATMNLETKAINAFHALVELDPKYHLSREYGPKITTPFYRAKNWITEHEPLAFAAAKPVFEGDVVKRLEVSVLSDPLTLGNAVRFHLRLPGAPWSTREVPLDKRGAATGVDAPSVEWWAELLGEHAAILTSIGSAEHPLVAKPQPVAVVPQEKPQVIYVREPGEEGPRFRPLAYGAMGLGVAGLGVGIFFGASSSSERSRALNVSRDANGVITSETQKQANQLQTQSLSDANTANILFAVGGGLAAAGVTLWLVGGQMSVSPAPGGVAVQGGF